MGSMGGVTILDSGLEISGTLLPEGASFESPRVVVVRQAEGGLGAPDVRVAWSFVLEILDGLVTQSDPEDESPESPESVDAEILEPVLKRLPWTSRWSGILALSSTGQLTRPAEFRLVIEWSYRNRRKAPRLVGPVVFGKDEVARARLSAVQWRCVEAASAPPDTSERALRIRVEELLRAVEAGDGTHDKPSVSIDPYLNHERAVIVQRLSAELEPVGGGFQVKPRCAEVEPEALERWYFQRGAKTGFQSGLRVRDADGRPRNVVLGPGAQRTVMKLRQLNVVSPETVARILDDPQAVFGDDFDLSGFSPRVKGIGLIAGSTSGIVSDTKVQGWFSVGDEELPEESDQLDLHDPATCQALLALIAEARAKGLNWFQHPRKPDVFIPITALLEARLREVVDAAPEEGAGDRLGLIVDESTREEAIEAEDFGELGALVDLPTLPRGVDRKLMRHQVVGVRWLLTLAQREDTGALLADDMGLGKTFQVLAFLSALDLQGRRGPHLIVAPVGLLSNWQRECDRFFPDQFHDIQVVRGTLKPCDPPLGGASLTLTGYESMRANEFAFARVSWDVVILDEAQKIKNPGTQVNRVARALSSRFRLAMTGTPVENSLEELWAIMDWAVPRRLGSLSVFREDFIAPLTSANPLAKAQLANRLLGALRPHFLRRLKRSELGDSLPELLELEHTTSLSAEQADAYRDILTATRNGDIPPLPALGRLLDTCAHPALAEGQLSGRLLSSDFPKALELINLLESIRSRGEKALVFTGRRPVQEWIAQLVKERFDLNAPIINGTVSSSEQRMRLVERFSQRNGFGVMILGPRAAGVGLNITAANHVIHYTREWNPAIEAQATDRAYRMGQRRAVHVHTIVAGKAPWGTTVEERLAELLRLKQEIIRRFVIPVEPVVISQDELLS